MEYEVNYKIISEFTAQIEAESEDEAKAKFREMDMRIEVSDNILDGGLDHSEIAIENIN
tara:strand:- start:332 stop:508 length:177 start_codon:yes stop_codon:yes gene_type:complete